MTITFLRVRPAERLAEPTATSRRREGTTAVEMLSPTSAELTAAHKAGVLVLSESVTDVEPAAWVVKPEEALSLAGRGVPGWRLTVVAEGSRESILDALARSGASFARSTRSEISEIAALSSLPGVDFSVSVFVDDVSQALEGGRPGCHRFVAARLGCGRDRRAAGGSRRETTRGEDRVPSRHRDRRGPLCVVRRDLHGLAEPGRRLRCGPAAIRMGAREGSLATGAGRSFVGGVARRVLAGRHIDLLPWIGGGVGSDPGALVGRHRADDGGGRGAVPGPGGPGRRGRARRRHPQRAGGRRHGHLCREPEHQLHQSLLLQAVASAPFPRARAASISAASRISWASTRSWRDLSRPGGGVRPK